MDELFLVRFNDECSFSDDHGYGIERDYGAEPMRGYLANKDEVMRLQQECEKIGCRVIKGDDNGMTQIMAIRNRYLFNLSIDIYPISLAPESKLQNMVTCMQNEQRARLSLIQEWQREDALCKKVKRNPKSLANISEKEQTQYICDTAVRKDGMSLKYVYRQQDSICLDAVRNNGNALQFVYKQNDTICQAAVKQDGNALQFVENQTPEICLLAVQQNGMALRYVASRYICDETLPIIQAAIKNNREAFTLINADLQSDALLNAVFDTDPTLFPDFARQPYEICLKAVNYNPAYVEAIHDEATKEQVLTVMNRDYTHTILAEQKTSESRYHKAKTPSDLPGRGSMPGTNKIDTSRHAGENAKADSQQGHTAVKSPDNPNR